MYCICFDIWLKGKWVEDEIGYVIYYDDSGFVFLEDMEEKFEIMKWVNVFVMEYILY